MIYILLSIYNGSKYLGDFLNSLSSQSISDWTLVVRDDGSSDGSIEMIKKFALENTIRIEFMECDINLGASSSFARLIEHTIQKEDCSYLMFADQDDVWLGDKIANTYGKMIVMESMYGVDSPLLVHTDLQVTDACLGVIDKSFWNYQYLSPKYKSLNRLIMQNNITGCTTMINKRLAKISVPIPSDAIMHDWWIGLVASAFGHIGYIEDRNILYRQHASNDTGAKHFSYFEIAKKAFTLFQKKDIYTAHLDKNIAQAKAFYERFYDELESKDRQMLEFFFTIKDNTFLNKRLGITKYMLLKQGLSRNIGLMLRI